MQINENKKKSNQDKSANARQKKTTTTNCHQCNELELEIIKWNYNNKTENKKNTVFISFRNIRNEETNWKVE